MAIYATEMSALQQSSISQGSSRYSMSSPDVFTQNINSQVMSTDAARFAEALQGTVPVGELDQMVQKQLKKLRELQSEGVVEVEGELSIGGYFAENLKTASVRLDNNINKIHTDMADSIKHDDLTIPDMMSMQFDLMVFGFELEVANGLVHKSGQHVDTFLRSQ